MGFKENDPDIPGELLLALDEGRVVFFCGAGVSRAKIRLSDFLVWQKKFSSRLMWLNTIQQLKF